MKTFNYENKQYLQELDKLPSSYYAKYISHIRRNLQMSQSTFLDIGCGNGCVVSLLQKSGYRRSYGVDMSKLFVHAAKQRGLQNIRWYSGGVLPFKNNFFDVVGSFNVLEHTRRPKLFLTENVRILKRGGYLLIACPNFLSTVMRSPHYRVRGISAKAKNFIRIIQKMTRHDYTLERMKPIIRKDFQYDDDAVVVTNILDLQHILGCMKCSIIYESGFIQSNSMISHCIDVLPIMKYMMPSCFMVVRKN